MVTIIDIRCFQSLCFCLHVEHIKNQCTFTWFQCYERTLDTDIAVGVDEWYRRLTLLRVSFSHSRIAAVCVSVHLGQLGLAIVRCQESGYTSYW